MKKILFVIIGAYLFCNIPCTSYANSSKEFFDKGVKMLQQRQYQEAVDHFTQSIQLDQDNAKTYKNRGVAYMELKKNDLAIEDFEKAVVINPGLKGLYSNLGAAWYRKKNFQKAVLYYDKEISLDDGQYIFYFNRALANAALKDYEKAIKDLSSTLELKPDFYWGLCFRGDILVKTGNLSEAKENFKKALEKYPEKEYAQKQLDNLKAATESKDNIEGKLYTVQVGAFLVKANVEKMVKRLSNEGYEARIFEFKKRDGKILHIIRVGKFADQKEAQKILESIKNKLGINAIIKHLGEV